MKKLVIGGIIVVLLGGYALWAASRSTALAPAPQDQNQTSAPSETTNPGTSGTDTGIGDSSSPGDEDTGQYKDGTYTGSVGSAAPYGNVQVRATISGGKLTAIKLLQAPDSPGFTSELAAKTFPVLVQEALIAQNANVDIISGATQNTEGFNASLSAALQQAQI